MLGVRLVVLVVLVGGTWCQQETSSQDSTSATTNQPFRAPFTLRVTTVVNNNRLMHVPLAVVDLKTAPQMTAARVSLSCVGNHVVRPNEGNHWTRENMQQSLNGGPKLFVGTRLLDRENALGFSFVQDHPQPVGLVRALNDTTVDVVAIPLEDDHPNHNRMLVVLDVKESVPTPKDMKLYSGWLSRCLIHVVGDEEDSQPSKGILVPRITRCSGTDWMSSILRVRHLADQGAAIARNAQPASARATSNDGISLLEIESTMTRSPVTYRRAFQHDISETMLVNTENKLEVFNALMCKNNMVDHLRSYNIRRDIGAAATGWLPSFIESAITPIGKAIVKVLFTIVPVIKYIIKGMIQALMDLITFGIVNSISDVILGPEMGVINSAIVQEIVFGLVPVISYMITGHFTVRITKGAIPQIAEALRSYLQKEAIPTMASATSHTLVSYVSESLSMQLPKKITHALTFTLSHSLTHAVPKYYYCQYCLEKNEYCGYCYGYWRSVRANRAWWKRPEGNLANDAGARDVVPTIPGVSLHA